jgi:PleD family two-component response regulator
MAYPSKALAFDVPEPGVACLQEALPGWQIDVVRGATAESLAAQWNPLGTDLLVLEAGADPRATWELCRFLASCTSYARDLRADAAEPTETRKDLRNQAHRTRIPIFVLLPAGREDLAAAALEAGAHNCLMLPMHAKEMASMLLRLEAGNQPGRHTLNLEKAQRANPWRDHGGQG